MMREYENHGRDQNNLERVEGNVTFNQTQIIQLSTTEIKTRPFNPTSPYRGLKRFDREDKDYFFGRDQCLTGLVNELEQTNVILLLGASGSGKSSVVRAGLIPWLGQKWGSDFVELILTPDHDPFESLYACLLAHCRQSEAQVVRAGNTDCLSQIVQALKQPESFWLIFVDQLEELFTTSQPEKRDRFIRSLVQLSQERSHDPSLKIVLTMRSDFLDRLDLDPASLLAKITHGHRPLITQMHRDELRLAIEQPAARHGVVLEADLVETIVNDVQGQAGYLPLLQYTLNRLWEEELQAGEMQQERTLHTRTYLRLGGVRGALQQHVDEIYAGFEQAGNHLATQRIFLKLVEIGGDAESGTDWKPVRRRANRSEFKDEQEKAVLAQLIDQMLVVSDRNLPAEDQESTVEIAHEILLTSWTTLDGWIRDNRRSISLRNRLNDDVARWQTKQEDDELWTGSKLEQVLELRNDPTFNDVLGGFSPIANQFIDASAGRRDRETKAQLEQERKLREQAEARAKAERQRTGAAIGALIGIIAISGWGAFQWRSADRGQIEARIASSKAKFSLNRNTFDSLIEALRLEKQFHSSIWFKNDPQLRAEVMEAVGQGVYWVKERNRLEHANFVTSVRFSPDSQPENQIIATASYDNTAQNNTVKIWSLDGKQLGELKGHTGAVTNISFSPDGQWIATASKDKTAKLWKRNGALVKSLEGHTKAIWGVSFSPNGQTIATASSDGTAKLWRQDGTVLTTLIGHTKEVNRVSFSPNDGQTIATASNDGTVRLWTQGGKPLEVLKGHNNQPVLSVSFSPDGQTIASGGKDLTVILWDVRTRKPQRTLTGFRNSVKDVLFSPDGQTIATASADYTVKLWNRDGALLETLPGHLSPVNSLSFSQDGTLLASASDDKMVKIWQLRSWLRVLSKQAKPLFRVNFSPDSQKLVISSINTVEVRSWDGKLLKNLWQDPGKTIYDVRFHPNSQALVVASDNQIKLRSFDGKSQTILGSHPQSVLGVNFSPDGQTIATASADQTAKLWNWQGKSLVVFKGHKQPVFRISFSPDGQTIATASYDGTAKLWNRDGSQRHSLEGHTAQVYAANFSPDGQRIVTASEDKTAKVWQQDGTLLYTLAAHTAGVTDAKFSPDGQKIVTVSDDSTIKFWTQQGELITTLSGHQAVVHTLSFSPDSKLLATVSSDQTALLWEVESISLDRLIGYGCDWLGDYLRTNPQAPKDVCQSVKK